MTPKKKKLIICILLALSPLLGILLLEIGLRVLWPQPPRGFSASLFTASNGLNKMSPETKGQQYSREFNITIEANSMGYRQIPGFTPEKPPEIILLGDSYCFGWGVEANETAGAKIAEKTGLNVYNLGIPGDSVYEQMRRLNELDNSRCKAIIILFFDNDLSDEIRRNRSSANHPLKIVQKKKHPTESSHNSMRRTLLKSHVVRLSGRIIDFFGLSNAAANMTGFKKLQAQAYKEVMQAHRQRFYESEIWDQLKRKYTELFDCAKKRSNQVILIRIVAPFVKEYPIPQNSDYDISLCDKELSQLAREQKVKYFSFSPNNSEKLFFKFDQHLTGTGHSALAEFILSKLQGEDKKRIAANNQQR